MLVQKRDEIDFYTNSSGIAKQEGRKKSAVEEDRRCKRETQTIYSQSQSLEWKQTLNSPCAQASLFGI